MSERRRVSELATGSRDGTAALFLAEDGRATRPFHLWHCPLRSLIVPWALGPGSRELGLRSSIWPEKGASVMVAKIRNQTK